MPNNKQPSESAKKIVTVDREDFRWLFTAEFADGTTIEQDQEDKSKTRTDGTGSTFSDVLARENDLVAFHLYHVSGKEAASVDLRTGAFVINGTPFHAHEQYFEPTQNKLRLVYFRETRINNDVLSTVLVDGSIDRQDGLNPRHFVNRYFIGWQTTTKAGKNVQHTIAVG